MAFRKKVTFILFSDFLDSLDTRLLKIISWVLSTSAKLKPLRAVNAWVWVSFRSTENSLYYSLCIMNFYFFSVAVLLCVVYPSGSSGLNHLCNIELFINLKNLFYPKNGRIFRRSESEITVLSASKQEYHKYYKSLSGTCVKEPKNGTCFVI